MAKTQSERDAAALPVDKLRPVLNPDSLGIQLSSELAPIQSLVGQDRALQAIEFGTGIQHRGYNMFVMGAEGSGRHSAISQLLKRKSATATRPDDWAYVFNYQTAWKPAAIRLPAGTAENYRAAVTRMLEDLRAAIPALFEGEDYLERRKKIDEQFQSQQEQAFNDLQQKAAQQNIALVRTQAGFGLAPVQDGQVIQQEAFNALPEAEQAAIKTALTELQKELDEVLQQLPVLEKQRRDQLRTLNKELSRSVVDAAIRTAGQPFREIAVIQDHLSTIAKDIVENIDPFIAPQQPAAATGGAPSPTPVPATPESLPIELDRRFTKYMVNAIVAQDPAAAEDGVPVIYEDHPTLARLVGRIEHRAHMGALVTDFTMIRPGALHRANGGYLILDAHRLLRETWSWDALKRALRSSSISITSTTEQLSVMATTSLDPEPIALDVKVVIIGDPSLYYQLAAADPDFADLFKVQVDFDDAFLRNGENIDMFARLIASIVSQRALRPLDAGALAAVIDEAARLADDAEKLTLKVGRLSDLLNESDHWAKESGRDRVTAADVQKAIQQQVYRADRFRESSHESIKRDIMFIDTDGDKVGQINGLSVTGIGSFSFGRPARITARVRMGAGKLIDIEREIALGGPLHSKGVLILSSYLAANFATDYPVSLWASLVFEQSYGGIDGDSASSTELYALLSALSGIPIWQGYAVTGSVNQLGEIQAIGGVNQKIEGFFDICAYRGLTGKQGVLIPKSNVAHLVLRPRVVEAVENGTFQVFAVETINQGMEILTGIRAGERDSNGRFPKNSINAKVEDRLIEFAKKRRDFHNFENTDLSA